MKKTLKKTTYINKGFTIVELLIVIVIIAILAAITLVAYNGIQSRAQQTANQATIKNYLDTLRLIKADTGDLPAGANNNSSCLGPDPQPTNCGAGGQTASAASTAATKNLLSLYGMTSQPAIVGVTSSNYPNGHLVYTSSYFGEPALMWFIPTNQECVGAPGRFRRSGGWVDGVTSSDLYGSGVNQVKMCNMSLVNL